MPCSTEGALMRRHVGGAGCGACGLGFAIPAPGRLGWPSGPTTRVCLQWLDEGVERRRRKPHGHVGVMPPGPSPEVRLRGAKTPPVERREASALIAKRAAPSTRCQTCYVAPF